MVRLLSLLSRDGAGVRQAVLSQFRAAGRHPAGVRDLRGRFPGAAHRSIHLRPLRRSRRPQVDADHDAAAHGLVHFRRGAGADLRQHRHLGRCAADGAALHSGRGRRRRVGRIGAPGDGVGEDQCTPRLHCVLAAVRCAGGTVPRQPGGALDQRPVRRCLSGMGLAGPCSC